MEKQILRPYYTMRRFTRSFYFSRVFFYVFSPFYSRFRYQHVGIQNASENARIFFYITICRDVSEDY